MGYIFKKTNLKFLELIIFILYILSAFFTKLNNFSVFSSNFLILYKIYLSSFNC